MNYWPTNHNKKPYKKNLSIEYKIPICRSENNENEQKSKNSNTNKESLYLFNGIVKVTKKSLKEKKNSEILNTNNDIINFTNCLYNNEEHLDDDKSLIIKNPENNNIIRNYNIITPSSTLKTKKNILDKSKSSLELSVLSKDISKENNIKKSLFNKRSKKLSLNYNNIIKGRSKRKSVEGDMTHKNRNSRNFNFFFKLKEKDKIPSKTPYLDKIWNTANKLNFKHKTNIHTKQNPGVSLVKRKTQEFNMNRITKINIKSEKEKEKEDESPKKSKDKSEKDKSKDSIDKKQEEKIEENETKVIDKKDKNIFSEEKIKKTNMNIIFNILNKPFFCCLK